MKLTPEVDKAFRNIAEYISDTSGDVELFQDLHTVGSALGISEEDLNKPTPEGYGLLIENDEGPDEDEDELPDDIVDD